MKYFLKKITSEKKTKNKNYDKIKEVEILLVIIKYADKPDKLESALKEINKSQVIDKNLHEFKNEIILDYVGAFEMVGNLKAGDQIRQTNIRFRNMVDFEAYVNSIDEGYDAEDAIFNGYIYKLDTPQFEKVNKSQYGKGCDFKHDITEYRGNNCYIPTNGYCFVKSVNFLTGGDYKEQYLNFIRNEKRRSNITTKARIQPLCQDNNNILGYNNDDRVFPRTVTNRNSALFLYNTHFCLIWKSQGVSFNKAIQELQDNFKIVDNYITEENINSHFIYEFIPKKIELNLTIFLYMILKHIIRIELEPMYFVLFDSVS